MGTFLDGLHSYEVVLLVLGAVLFIVLIVALAAFMVRGRPFAAFLPFFGISIVMMGFPAIKSVQYKDGVISIDKTTTELQKDPTNAALRGALEKQVSQVADRPATSPSALTSIARAQFALGNNTAAETNLQKALQADPALAEAQELKKRIDLDRTVTSLTSQVEQHPSDAAARQKLQSAVAQFASLPLASPVALAHLAAAQASLGNVTASLKTADQALTIKPNLAAAREVKSRIEGAAAPH